MGSTQSLGFHADCCPINNEFMVQSILRYLRCPPNARHASGLSTRITTSKTHVQSNALAENAAARVSAAATISNWVKLGPSNGVGQQGTVDGSSIDSTRLERWFLSSWSMEDSRTNCSSQRTHHCQCQGLRPGPTKMVQTHFRKTNGQDAHIAYDGEKVLLSKSVKGIGQDWGLSLYSTLLQLPPQRLEVGSLSFQWEDLALLSSSSLVPMETIVARARNPKAETVLEKAPEENAAESAAREGETAGRKGSFDIGGRTCFGCCAHWRRFTHDLRPLQKDHLRP